MENKYRFVLTCLQFIVSIFVYITIYVNPLNLLNKYTPLIEVIVSSQAMEYQPFLWFIYIARNHWRNAHKKSICCGHYEYN